MKYETYRKQLDSLREDIIQHLIKGCLNEKALEIEFHNPIVHAYIDDQTNEVIGRLNIEQKVVVIDSGFEVRWLSLDRLTLDELLSLFGEFEQGNYEVWEVID